MAAFSTKALGAMPLVAVLFVAVLSLFSTLNPHVSGPKGLIPRWRGLVLLTLYVAFLAAVLRR